MRVVLLLIAEILLASSSFCLGGEDWPQWRGPQRDGRIAGGTPWTAQTSGHEVWSAEAGTGFASLTVAGNQVVTMGNTDDQDVFSCFDLATGATLWTHSYPAPLDPNLFEGGPTATPTVLGDRVFTISRAGEIYCLNLADGQVRWHVQVPESLREQPPSWGFSGSPLLLDERLYFNAGSHGLCLDAGTGETVWASDDSELPGYTSPLLMHRPTGPVLLLETEKSLVAVDPATGQLIWQHPWITRYGINAADPLVIDDQQILVTSGYAKGASLLKLADGDVEEVWRTRDLRTQMSPGVLIDGMVYANDGDADRDCKLVCLDVSTGKLKWMHRGYGSCSLIAVGSQLLVLSEQGELAIVNAQPEKLDEVARVPLLTGKCWTPPTFVAGKVLARNAAGHVVCVELNRASVP